LDLPGKSSVTKVAPRAQAEAQPNILLSILYIYNELVIRSIHRILRLRQERLRLSRSIQHLLLEIRGA
jgi:hypothetical protein